MAGIKGAASSARVNTGGCGRKHVERWTCILLFTLVTFVNHLRAVQIISMSVPQWIQNGTSEEILLDCEYDLAQDEEKVVIKWFLNDDPQPIYQWIPDLSQRSASPKYKDHLVLDNQAEASSNKDLYYRALRIRRPTTEFTGTYRCEVYSLDSQDSRASQMIVYAPPKKLQFFVTEAGPMEAVNVTCEAEGVFPLPQLRLYQLPPGGSQRILLPGKKTLTNQSGLFDIRLISQLDDATEPMYFECELQINSTDYKQYERLQYIPGVPITTSVIEEKEDTENGVVRVTASKVITFIVGLLSVASHRSR